MKNLSRVLFVVLYLLKNSLFFRKLVIVCKNFQIIVKLSWNDTYFESPVFSEKVNLLRKVCSLRVFCQSWVNKSFQLRQFPGI